MAARCAIRHAGENKIAARQKIHLVGGIVFIVCVEAPAKFARNRPALPQMVLPVCKHKQTPGSTAGQQTQRAVFFIAGLFYPTIPKPDKGERRKQPGHIHL